MPCFLLSNARLNWVSLYEGYGLFSGLLLVMEAKAINQVI